MSNLLGIYDAFGTRLNIFAAAQSPALTVAYPTLSFDPPAGLDVWLECRAFWGDTQNYGLDNVGPSVDNGFFRVGVTFRPSLSIMNGPLQLVNALKTEFSKGSTYGDALQEQAPSVGGVITESDRAILPVTISWRTVG